MPTVARSELRKPVHAKSYGIEIECCMHPTDRDQLLYNKKGFFIFEGDASIASEHTQDMYWRGVEMVSHPLPYKMLRKQLNTLKKYRFVYNSSCGIHIHVSKVAVSRTRMVELLICLRNLLGQQEKELFGRVRNFYCDPFEHNRYCSINRTNEHTVEFRMWSAGDIDWAKECLRRTKLMVEYKGKYSYENLLDLFTRPEK